MTSELKDGIGSLTPATESAKFIKAIDKTTVHRICSGQVVLTLSIAVKELVENSIDAGATSVEVRLKDYGASLLEVCDNGKGVEEENFEGLTLKHHTSKLQDFGDLVGVKTFGFRGEALSSLCALSNLSVTTRHNSQAVGAKLVYDHNGKLTSKVATSRQVGMTVSLQNLFSTLPVRHKEFQRNIKKEFAKMVQILYSYCLISTGVRITCTNQTEKGKKTVVVATDGHSTIRENISSVFGAKQVSSVIEFKQENASSDMLSEYGLRTEANSQGDSLFTLEGFISSCAHGQGRSASDRQFYFINSRPCDPTKVMKLVNEVYHYYNRHQFPFIVLDIHLKQDDVDVNVTPDKRQILVNHEKLLLATLKTSITRLYENIPSTYSMQNTSFNSPLNRSFSSPQSSSSPNSNASSGKTSSLALKFGRNLGCSPLSQSSGSLPSSPSVSGMKRSFSQDSSESTKKQPKLESFFQNKSPSSGSFDSTTKNSIAILPNSSNDIPSSSQSSGVELNGSLMECVGEMEEEETSDKNSFIRTDLELNALPSKSGTEDAIIPDGHQIEDGIGDAIDADTEDCSNQVMNYKKMSVGQDNSSDISDIQSLKENTPPEYSPSSSQFIDTQEIGLVSDIGNNKLLETKSNVISALSKFSRPSVTASPSCKKAQNATNAFLNNLMARKSDVKKSNPERQEVKMTTELEAIPCESEENEAETMEVENDICGGTDNRSSPLKKLVVFEEYNPEDYKAHRKTKCIDFSIESLREKINKSLESKEEKSLTRRFHAKIAPTDNQSAEDELKKEISKDMFTEMEVLGQFNLGFIIAKLGSDLFIVDQHATDEKYNFETLQQTCVLQNQRLIVPQLLELTAVNESILLDNIEIFKKNGFEFKIEEEETVGRRVSLTSMPFSRGWEFGREDIDELIFMLSDSPGHMCRPSRVRAMFASRSCRKSVMIGTALTNVQMRKLLIHMGEIEQPWNCPHGRPTMRHLVNIDMILATQD